MNRATRVTLFIMLGFMVAEGWPMALTLHYSPPGVLFRIYAAPASLWPAWLAAAVVAAVYCMHSVRSLPMIGQRLLDPHPLKLLALPFALITGTMEELWFRRLAMDWAQGEGGGMAAQVAVSAVTFGLVHAIWGVFARKWRVALGAMLATGLLGGALGVVYLMARRQVAPCVWSHIAINLIIEPWLLFAALSLSIKKPGSGGASGESTLRVTSPHSVSSS